MTVEKEKDLQQELEKFSNKILNTLSEQQSQEQKALNVIQRKLKWINLKLKSISQVRVGRGAAVGVGCGAGIGIGVQANAYINPFNLRHSGAFNYGIGVGAGCGVGLGYGYGLGVGGKRIGKQPKSLLI
eukprot:TRINITY_DN251_c0_g1_i2.p1 TRINITY_DN251_c0_g1~~TRINITY_DN251_c0_g1_i2.p1  ORF type:complete len:129 (-),score=17.51 TRINITY_DN251_c0_g1_i2:245-631(-)